MNSLPAQILVFSLVMTLPLLVRRLNPTLARVSESVAHEQQDAPEQLNEIDLKVNNVGAKRCL